MMRVFYAGILALVFSHAHWAKVVSNFERKILDRNGDVYVLITSKSGNNIAGTGLWKFTRVDNYARTLVDHPKIKSDVNIYSGLSVDKFGHISLFRDAGDTAPIGLLQELEAGPPKLHPGEGSAWPGLKSISARFNGGGLGGPMVTRNATPAGWAYVVEPNGKYGWVNLYDSSRVALRNGPGGSGYVYGAAKKTFPAGTEIIPQGRDQGFNAFGGAGDKHGGRAWYHAIATDYVFSQDSATSQVALFHPPIHAFWVTDTAHRGGRNIYDVEKSVTALYLDKFLTKADNRLLATEGRADARFTLVAGVDFFQPESDSNTDVFVKANNALNTSLSFSQQVFSYNVCYDMCGSGGQAVVQAPIVVNEGRAKFSSGGSSTQKQRSYMVKTASRNQGTQIVTSVVELKFDGTEYTQTDILSWNGGAVPAPAKTSNQSPMDSGASDTNVIVYSFDAAAGGGVEFAKSVQTSRRVKAGDETKDYVYISNLPFSHFNVSESFWGTGGVVWWALEKPGKILDLHFEQKNHQLPDNRVIIASGGSPVRATNVEALQAIGADGDNFIYILHGGTGTDGRGGLEMPEDMARLILPANAARLDALFKEEKLVEAAPPFPLAVGAGLPCPTAAGPCEFSVTLRRATGLVLEKIAPLAGSKPVRIGLLPLADTGGTCQAVLVYPTPADIGGTLKSPFVCTGGAANDLLDNFNIEMAVINVANPPATGGDPQLDIVNGVDETNNVYVEDQEYTFYMENPPKFNGPYAQLGLVPNPELNVYDLVQMASNYDETGIKAIQEGLVEGSAKYKRFYDDDGRMSRLLPSYIWRNLAPGQNMVSPGTKTLRWRWRVIAKTPPQSNRDFTVPLPGEVVKVQTCSPLLGAAALASTANVKRLKDVGYLDAANTELGMTPVPGVMLDSCWKDLVLEDEGMIRPEELKVRFPDPGEYEVWLMFGGLRFNADDLTFLDSPTSVQAENTVTWYVKTIHVGSRAPQAGDEIQELVVVNNDLNSNRQTRAGIYTSNTEMFNRMTDNGGLEKLDSSDRYRRPPVLPTANYQKGSVLGQPVVVTHEKQHTPIVAEAEIQLFRVLDVEYQNIKTASNQAQTKTKGVGAWDYTYPGGGAFAGHSLLDKRNTYPSNYLPGGGINRLSRADSAGVDTPGDKVKNRRGNDASGDPATSTGFNAAGDRFFNLAAPRSDTLWSADQFSQAHQGTLATCKHFQAFSIFATKADNACRVNHPEYFYTWWEVKYAWFMRYRRPDGTVQKKVLKTGNLGEIYALHALAYGAKSSAWQHVVRNLAPKELSNDTWNDYQLFKDLGDGKVKVRIPLLHPGGVLNGTGEDEMHASLRNLDAMGTDFATIYETVHPVSFQVPSAPSVIELGLQLFYPIMNWEGRDKVQGVDGTDRFAYFDAVYWGNASEAACAAGAVPGDSNCLAQEADNNPKVATLTFGQSSPISTWRRFARVKSVTAIGGAKDTVLNSIGLSLAGNIAQGARQNTGGLRHNGGSNLVYEAPGGNVDDFVDILVLDQTRPQLRTISGESLTARAGGRADDDIVLEAEDNNPYGIYRSHTELGGAPTTQNPALVHFSYEIAADSRNRYGVGLYKGTNIADRRAYGFNLSHISWDGTLTISQAQLAAQPQFTILDPLGGRPFTVSEPGYNYLPGNHAAGDYYFPAGGSGFEMVRRIADPNAAMIGTSDRVAHETALSDSANRQNLAEPLYYAPLNPIASMRTSGMRDRSLRMNLTDDRFMLRFLPKVNEDPYNFNPVYMGPDGSARDLVQYVPDDGVSKGGNYQRFDTGCLSGAGVDPVSIKAVDQQKCQIFTRWIVPSQSIVAPYFMNPSQNETYNLYAKARDVRMSSTVPSLQTGFAYPALGTVAGTAGGWPSWDFAPLQLRMGAENGEETGGTDLVDRIRTFMDSETMRHGTDVGDLLVADNDSPNFRVIISESKYRTQVEYTVMRSQGFVADSEQHSNRVLFFRTQDPRGTMAGPEAAIFASAAIPADTNLTLTEANLNDLRVHQLLGAGNTPENQVYRIPEDVRFEIRVLAADNRNLDEISVRISGGHTGLYTHPDGYQAMEGQYHFPATISSAGRVYQQMKFASAFHLYPKAQFYDVIKVEVFDNPGFAGNGAVLHIPIEVIDQQVFFRQIGSERKVN